VRIAILTRPDFRSPRILAESLQSQLEEQRVSVDIFYEISILTRLVSYKESKLKFHFWFKDKWQHYIKDRKVLKKLFKYDVIIISECTPNGFLRQLYNVERLRQIVQKPVLFFEVYYLGIFPQLIDMLKVNEEALPDRYEMHLSVSRVNDMKQYPSDKWFSVGLLAKGFNLYPKRKNEILAILDFPQINYLRQREIQIKALERAGIKYISLENEYTFEDVRKIYMDGALFFLQTPEAFGIAILECLCCGTQIFTPRSWPTAWRITVDDSSWGEGKLPDCFTEYIDEDDLVKKLVQFKNTFDLTETPKKVFQNFLTHYPQYYYGNQEEITRFLLRLNEMVKK
jgi:hypothetical protein